MALSNEHKNTRTPVLNNQNLFRRDCNVCAYCGRTHRYEKLSRDHIHPKKLGGKDTWMNCVTSCKSCNNEKDFKTLDQLGWELVYVPYVPDRAEELVLRNRTILADQMEFLKSFIPAHSRVHKLLLEH
jgi:5-methylcytosine-specific restriction endonuclease McrA